jgi:hypothetical protein
VTYLLALLISVGFSLLRSVELAGLAFLVINVELLLERLEVRQP